MDFSKMTKEQLITLSEQQQHLAQAVEAKDKEISVLKKESEQLRRELVEAKAKATASQQNEDIIKKLGEQNKTIIAYSNAHIGAFRNFMKNVQGALDNAIELDGFITQSVSENNKKGQ